MNPSFLLGKQQNGESPWYTKQMAINAIAAAVGHTPKIDVAGDIGAGAGEFTSILAPLAKTTYMLDYDVPENVPTGVTFRQADLNEKWPLTDGSLDMGIALEVIEHVENPRHFMREFARILKPGGFGFITTPNQHSWVSKLNFILRGEHRSFGDLSYPAHITALLKCDIQRMLLENQLVFREWIFANEDCMPLVHWRVRIRGIAFSASIGVLFQKL